MKFKGIRKSTNPKKKGKRKALKPRSHKDRSEKIKEEVGKYWRERDRDFLLP